MQLCTETTQRLIEIVDANYDIFLANGDERARRCLHSLAVCLDLLRAHGLQTHDVQAQMENFLVVLEASPDEELKDSWAD